MHGHRRNGLDRAQSVQCFIGGADKMPQLPEHISYSEKYYDDYYEYRHVIVPPEVAKQVPKTHLMTESEWRNIGVQQSVGWVHYMVHTPEPHVLLFRRPKMVSNIGVQTTLKETLVIQTKKMTVDKEV